MNTRSLGVCFLFLTTLSILLFFGSQAQATPTVAYDDFNDGDFIAQVPEDQQWGGWVWGDPSEQNGITIDSDGGADGSKAVRFYPMGVGNYNWLAWLNGLKDAFEQPHKSKSWTIGFDECWFPTDEDSDQTMESTPQFIAEFYVDTTGGEKLIDFGFARDAEAQKTYMQIFYGSTILDSDSLDWGDYDPLSGNSCFRYKIMRSSNGDIVFKAVALDSGGVESDHWYTLLQASGSLIGATVDGDTVISDSISLDMILATADQTDDGYDAELDNILANADGDAWMKDSITVALDDFNDADMVATIPPSALWRFVYDDPQTPNSVSLQDGVLRWTVGGDDEDVPKASLNVEGAFDHVHSSPSFQMKFDERWYAANPNEDQYIESKPIVSIYGIVKTEYSQTEYDKDFKIELKRLAREQRTEIRCYLKGDDVHYHSVFSDHTDFPSGYSGPAEESDNYRYYLKRALDGTFQVIAVLLDGNEETDRYILGEFDTDMIGLSNSGYEITSNAIEFTRVEFSDDSSGRDGYEATVDNVELTSLANDWDMSQYVDGHPANFDHYVDLRFFGSIDNGATLDKAKALTEAVKYCTAIYLPANKKIYVDNPLIIDRQYPLFFVSPTRVTTGFFAANKDKDTTYGGDIPPLFRIIGATLINFTNLTFNPCTSYSSIENDFYCLLSDASIGVEVRSIQVGDNVDNLRLEIQDSIVINSIVEILGGGTYIIQGTDFDGKGDTTSDLILDNPNAELWMFGGALYGGLREPSINPLDDQWSNYSLLHQEQGRLALYGVFTKISYGHGEIVVETPSTIVRDGHTVPHVIAGGRTEGNTYHYTEPHVQQGYNGPYLLYVPKDTSSDKPVDVILEANEIYGNPQPEINYTAMADYNAAGILWLLGNMSYNGRADYVAENDNSSSNFVAFGNWLYGNAINGVYTYTCENDQCIMDGSEGECYFTGVNDIFECAGDIITCDQNSCNNVNPDCVRIEENNELVRLECNGGSVFSPSGNCDPIYNSNNNVIGSTCHYLTHYLNNNIMLNGDYGCSIQWCNVPLQDYSCGVANNFSSGNYTHLCYSDLKWIEYPFLLHNGSSPFIFQAGNLFSYHAIMDYQSFPSVRLIAPSSPYSRDQAKIVLDAEQSSIPEIPLTSIPASVKLSLPRMQNPFSDMTNVMDYINDPQYGNTTIAIQAALDSSKGYMLYFPSGTYMISSPLYWNHKAQKEGESVHGGGIHKTDYGWFTGTGMDGDNCRTTIKRSDDNPGPVFLSESIANFTIQGICFESKSYFDDTSMTFPLVDIEYGKYLDSDQTLVAMGAAPTLIRFYNCGFSGGKYGMAMGIMYGETIVSSQCDQSMWIGCHFKNSWLAFDSGHQNALLNMIIDGKFGNNYRALGTTAMLYDGKNYSGGSFNVISADISNTYDRDIYLYGGNNSYYLYGIHTFSSPAIIIASSTALHPHAPLFDDSSLYVGPATNYDHNIEISSTGTGIILLHSILAYDGTGEAKLWLKTKDDPFTIGKFKPFGEKYLFNLHSTIPDWDSFDIDQPDPGDAVRAQAFMLQ